MFKINSNGDKLADKLEELAKSSNNIAEEVVEQLGSIVKTNARHYVPVDTGALKASIDLEVNGSEATIGSPLEYAPYVEYGTSKQAPQPYLIPAINDAQAQANSVIKRVVKKYVND